MSHTLFITGAAGYVGAMLCNELSKRDDVDRIIGLDVEPMPELLAHNPKIAWIQANTADASWQEEVRTAAPDVVIHTAWHIREMYGRRNEQWRWNVEGSQNVFRLALSLPSVARLVYFSTASIYGAYADNTIEHRFTEDEPMREEEYIYGVEKRKVEEILKEEVGKAQRDGLVVSVVRPAAITGPRGRFSRVRFGLQSALAGKLTGNIFYRLVSLLVSYVPATPWWVRQFIHEDDVADIVALLALDPQVRHAYEVFNIAPPGEAVLAPHMAEAVGKKVLMVRPWMVRLAFFFFWHLSRGKVPNGPGVWRFYSYPIVMDGSKLTRRYGYEYQYDSQTAFRSTRGRYESVVPEPERRG